MPVKVRAVGSAVRDVRIVMYRLRGTRRTVVAVSRRAVDVGPRARVVRLALRHGQHIVRGRYLVIARATVRGVRASTANRFTLR